MYLLPPGMGVCQTPLRKKVNKLGDKKVNFYIFKQFVEADQSSVVIENFQILNTAYRYKRLKRNASQSLFN